jgi:hypothetical protein
MKHISAPPLHFLSSHAVSKKKNGSRGEFALAVVYCQQLVGKTTMKTRSAYGAVAKKTIINAGFHTELSSIVSW